MMLKQTTDIHPEKTVGTANVKTNREREDHTNINAGAISCASRGIFPCVFERPLRTVTGNYFRSPTASPEQMNIKLSKSIHRFRLAIHSIGQKFVSVKYQFHSR